MKLKVLGNFLMVFVFVLFSCNLVNAQVDKVKKTVDKTKDVTVDTTKKTVELTKDAADVTKDVTNKAADKTKDTTVKAAKTTGGYTVKLVDNLKEVPQQTTQDGKWLTVTRWDGKKWVSKREFFPNKK